MEIKRFRGMRNTTSDERLSPGYLEEADNLDLDDTGKVLDRDAVDLLVAGSYHSLWSDGDMCLVMNGAALKRVNPDFSLTTLATLSNRRTSYARLQNVVLLSNGVDTLRLQSGTPRPWGTPVPTSQPQATASWGSLPPGTYQYAMTYRRADGQESGTGAAAVVELADGGGIVFSGLEDSTDDDVRDKMVYLSAPNGEELFLALVVPAGTASAAYRAAPAALGRPITTQFASPPPAGSIVEIFNGQSVVVVGDTAYYSDPYALELFRLHANYMQFPGEITMFAAVNDGVFVATREKTWFLSGGRFDQAKLAQVLDYGAVPGTAAKASSGALSKPGGEGPVTRGGAAVFWTSPRGVCVGTDGGEVANMTELTFSFPSAARGGGIVRQTRGYTQYLAALEDAGAAVNAYN